jgi:hypothetical protein
MAQDITAIAPLCSCWQLCVAACSFPQAQLSEVVPDGHPCMPVSVDINSTQQVTSQITLQFDISVTANTQLLTSKITKRMRQ